MTTTPSTTACPRPAPALEPSLPAARGPLSRHAIWLLRGKVDATDPVPTVPRDADPGDDDLALALYVLYELHYRGFDGVDDSMEWDPTVLDFRRRLEERFLAGVRDLTGPVEVDGSVAASLQNMFDTSDDQPSLAGWCDQWGDHRHLREQAVMRSAYQLKEADPHSFGLPRLTGEPKAALVKIQFDEYGEGVLDDMHARLFALHMERIGLDPAYGAYLDLIPGSTLATVNLVTLFGLHRRWRGALTGHLAMFEMSSVPVMAAYSSALRRLGYDAWTRLFYDVHVTADAEHQTVACYDLAEGLARQDPRLSEDIVFGAKALAALEARITEETLEAWEDGRTALRGELPPEAAPPGLTENRMPADDPRTPA
jgi:hypothetical protein